MKIATFFLALLMLLPLPAFALSSNWERDGSVDARLISGLEGVGLKKTIPLGLEIRLEPGWHTYWRSPGGAGLPPDIDWTNSLNPTGNLAKATLLYPTPTRFNDQGMETIGYQSRVIFPIDADVLQPGAQLNIDATVHLLACSDLCVPKTFNLKLIVPHDSAIEGPEADILNPARALVPGHDENAAGLSLKSVTAKPSSLSFDIGATSPLSAPDIFVESQPDIAFGAPEWKPAEDRLSGKLIVKPLDAKDDLSKLGGAPLTLTIVDSGRALEVETTIPSGAGQGGAPIPSISFGVALLLAIIGGFLLNLMPCVLPVLSLKIFSFLGHGGGETKAVRRSFLMTAAGIMSSFIVMALVTVILKQLGLTLGWGVQFQQPVFLIFLILLLTVFAANMWGLFEINLPEFLADRLASHHPKMATDFATGALATLLATPCTAPFMGTAVGFALASGSTTQIFAIFIALGFGMIIPYFSIAIFPEVAIFLPKPGKWMLRLQYVLGVALALTAAWLLWILSAQLMTVYAITVGVCMVGIVALLGLHIKGFKRGIVQLGLLGFVGIAVTLSWGGAPPPGTVNGKPAEAWQVFDETSIPIQVAAGHTVFVDITADWCLTCKANKRFVLSKDEVSNRLFHSDVVPMQGDWTTPNEQISNFLRKYRRGGIPFDVVYGPGAPQGITLPEILSSEDVINALDKASGRE